MSGMVDLGSAWREVERLISVNAKHRKGFRLQEIDSDEFVLSQASDELSELQHAQRRYELAITGSDREVAIELADLMGVLFHFAIRRGYTAESLSRLMLDKFKDRFDSGDK